MTTMDRVGSWMLTWVIALSWHCTADTSGAGESTGPRCRLGTPNCVLVPTSAAGAGADPVKATPPSSTRASSNTSAPSSVAPDATGSTVSPRRPGTSATPIEYDDPALRCYEFRAHNGDKTNPYVVPAAPDLYKGFTFNPPWQGEMFVRSIRSLIDNEQVIHHMLLYKSPTAGVDGQISDQVGAHPEGNLLHVWTPGSNDLYLDPELAQSGPGDTSYLIETHYNNDNITQQRDSSGFELCVTPTAPKYIASLSWLGTDAIFGTSATGTCTPTSAEPIEIIAGTPHMHLKGRHLSAVLTRQNGMSETLLDTPFDFEYQVTYPLSVTMLKGDSITTTCTYSEPATFGRSTRDEMCYLFTLYYPAEALTNQNILGTLLHGPDTCL